MGGWEGSHPLTTPYTFLGDLCLPEGGIYFLFAQMFPMGLGGVESLCKMPNSTRLRDSGQ